MNKKFPAMISILKKQQTTNNRPTTVKEMLKASVEKPQNGKRRLDDLDYTCMSPPKKTVNVTLDSDNKIKDSFTKSVTTPKTTTQCILNSTETTANATTSSASMPQILPSTSSTLSDDTFNEYFGPDTTLDNHLDEDTLNFIVSRTTQTETAGPTTDDGFYGRLMAIIMEGIAAGHIKRQTLQNNESNEQVLQLTLNKK